MVGICGTDLHAYAGIRRFYLSENFRHELASEVLEIGENEKGIRKEIRL